MKKNKTTKSNNSDSSVKNFLKTIKLNEEVISMVLGALVIVIVGILVVNYFKDKKGATLPAAVSTTNPISKAEAGKTHTVVKGETLWSIAEDAYGSGYNWVDIYKENKLTAQNVKVGQTLNIPNVKAKQPTSTKPVTTAVASGTPVATATVLAKATGTPVPTGTAKATATPSATATAQASAKPSQTPTSNATSYTVAKGDNLWKIAVAQYGNGYKWVEIARANKLKNPNVIHPGNVLTLPR